MGVNYLASQGDFRQRFKEYYDSKFEEVFNRVQEMQDALPKKPIPSHIDSHFQEAIKCFQYGLYQSSVIMLRVTLEVAFRYRLMLEEDRRLRGNKQKLNEYVKEITEWPLSRLERCMYCQRLFASDENLNQKLHNKAIKVRKRANWYTHIKYGKLVNGKRILQRQVEIEAKGGETWITPLEQWKIREPELETEKDFIMRSGEGKALEVIRMTGEILDEITFFGTPNFPFIV